MNPSIDLNAGNAVVQMSGVSMHRTVKGEGNTGYPVQEPDISRKMSKPVQKPPTFAAVRPGRPLVLNSKLFPRLMVGQKRKRLHFSPQA